jgi:hypothetical protein
MTKLLMCSLAIFSPAFAQLSGDWVGATKTNSQGSLHFVLHLTGPDTELRATVDSPDQGIYGVPVAAVTFSGSILEFSVPRWGLNYSGVLGSTGSIAGKTTQRGVEIPLALERTSTQTLAAAAPGFVENGRYRDTATGIEFDLPQGWYFLRADPDPSNPGGIRIFNDSSHKAVIMTAYLQKGNIAPENVSNALDGVIAHQISMRAGQTGQGQLHEAPQYKIRDGSIEHTYIGGHPAIRAIGEYQRGGKNFAELLAWVFTEHSRTYFMLRAPAENLDDLQGPFDQMLQSAKIP